MWVWVCGCVGVNTRAQTLARCVPGVTHPPQRCTASLTLVLSLLLLHMAVLVGAVRRV